METLENETKITAEQTAGIEVVDAYALRKLMRKLGKDKTSLTEVCFPDATVVDIGVFSDCENLKIADFPKCVKVEAGAFGNCQKLETVNLPLCQKIGVKAFSGCSSLAEIDLPSCLRVLDFAFQGCGNVEFIHLPVCELIGEKAFALGDDNNTVSLTSVNLPACKEIGPSAFDGVMFRTVSIPVCEGLAGFYKSGGMFGGLVSGITAFAAGVDFGLFAPFASCEGTTFMVSSPVYVEWDRMEPNPRQECLVFGKDPYLVLADEGLSRDL